MNAIMMTAVAAAALVIAVPVMSAAAAVAAGTQAAVAADAGALAASDAVNGWAVSALEPCALAAHVVTAHNTSLIDCSVDFETGEARIHTSVRAGLIRVTRSARAGPQ